MNIASFIVPKHEVAFLYEDYSLRQGLEKIRYHGYAAIPVLTKDNKYVCTISEGDFLWYLVDTEGDNLHKKTLRSVESTPIKKLFSKDKNEPVRITSTIEELLTKSIQQNFIPVIDDRDYFIGIVTRKDIIKHFYEKLNKEKNITEYEDLLGI